MSRPKVVVVDDDDAVRFTLEEALEAAFDVVPLARAQDALAHAAEADAVLTDLVMPDKDGFWLTAELRELDRTLPVILLTAHGSERIAVQAMRSGAYDYLSKPFAVDELRLVVGRAVEARRLRKREREGALERACGGALIGSSPAWLRLMTAIRRAGPKDVPVLVRGQTGTGKELVAAALHADSDRRDGPFVRFNCGAIPEGLAEAELFGHVRGAFTGATGDRQGYFLKAHRGTLVLDEVGELPLPAQATLLRALQHGEVQRVGASGVERVDVRVVACTHRDLEAAVRSGAFREDLYFRLAVVELAVPSLAERREDIPALLQALRDRWAARLGMEGATFSPALVEALARRTWPGNVRELENAVARILTLHPGEEIGIEALVLVEQTRHEPPSLDDGSLRAQIETFERQVLSRALAECGGNQSEAARRLRITRTTLLDKLKRYGLR